MNIDFIKWLVDYAEGFRFVEKMHDIECPDQMYIGEYLIIKNKVRWPLLLQKAIEGINREYFSKNGVYNIFPNPNNNNYEVFNLSELVDGFEINNIDQAKEEALNYIWEQETI